MGRILSSCAELPGATHNLTSLDPVSRRLPAEIDPDVSRELRRDACQFPKSTARVSEVLCTGLSARVTGSRSVSGTR